jgi:phasin family protein
MLQCGISRCTPDYQPIVFLLTNIEGVIPMTQATKKSTTQSAKVASAKLATNVANKAAKNTYAAVETGRASAENVVKIGGKAVQDFISSSAGEAQKAQEKAFALSREGAEQFSKSADAAARAMYEAVAISRDNIETCVECSNAGAALAKDISSEVFEFANKAFSEQLELSKELFACRTINDMFELQNRVFKSSVDNLFNESAKLSGMVFEYTSEALEPVNERIAQATDQFNKVLTTK